MRFTPEEIDEAIAQLRKREAEERAKRNPFVVALEEYPAARWAVALTLAVMILAAVFWVGDRDVRNVREQCDARCAEDDAVLVEIHRDPVNFNVPTCVCAVELEVDPE